MDAGNQGDREAKDISDWINEVSDVINEVFMVIFDSYFRVRCIGLLMETLRHYVFPEDVLPRAFDIVPLFFGVWVMYEFHFPESMKNFLQREGSWLVKVGQIFAMATVLQIIQYFLRSMAHAVFDF